MVNRKMIESQKEARETYLHNLRLGFYEGRPLEHLRDSIMAFGSEKMRSRVEEIVILQKQLFESAEMQRQRGDYPRRDETEDLRFPQGKRVPYIGKDGQEYWSLNSLQQADADYKSRTYIPKPKRRVTPKPQRKLYDILESLESGHRLSV